MQNLEDVATAATASMMTTSMSGAVAYPGPFIHLQYSEWSPMAGNAYPNTGTADPNAYSYMPNVAFATPVYPPVNEVINVSSSRDNDRRGGRGRNRKIDSYDRIGNPNDMQTTGYLVQQGQFNQMCHPAVPYLPFAVGPQQHPAAGPPIFMASPQAHSQPQIQTHRNNNSQYPHSNYSTHSTVNTKQHSRQSSGQNYYNQDGFKIVTICPKIHEKKIHDGQNTAQQSVRPLPNTNDYELTKRTKPIVINNNGNNTVKNGPTNVALKKPTVNKNGSLTHTIAKVPATEPIVTNDCNNIKAPEHDHDVVPVNSDDNIIQNDNCPAIKPDLPVKTIITEPITVSVTESIVIPEIGNEKTLPITVPEIPATTPEIKPTVVTSTTPPVPTQTVTQSPPSATERTFASILKKSNIETRGSLPFSNRATMPRVNATEIASVNHDNVTTKTQQQDTTKQQQQRTFTAESQALPKTVIDSAVNDRKKIFTDITASPLSDPASYRIGGELL